MYGCESWTIKKAESRRIDAFQLWCWRRLLRVPWTTRRSNQSILKEISPKEGLMLKLKLQYFGHMMQRTNSFKKTLILGKTEGRRRRGRQRMRWFLASPMRWTWVWANSRSWWWTGKPGVLQSMGLHRVGHDWATELNWSFNFHFLSSAIYPLISLMSDPLWSLELWSSRLHCPWDSPGKDNGLCCHFLLQGIFQTWGSNPCLICLLHWKVGSLPVAPPGKSSFMMVVQLLSCVWLFATPWTAVCQASLSITNYWSLLKLISIHSTMSSAVIPFSCLQSFPASGSFPMS